MNTKTNKQTQSSHSNRTSVLIGRLVGRSVGWSVGRSLGESVAFFVCLFNLCSSENTARLLAGVLNLMCINKYILFVRCSASTC